MLALCSVPLQPVLVVMETGILTNASGEGQVKQSKVQPEGRQPRSS